MRKIIGFFAVWAVVLAAVSSCTHNNGDIGPLFGTWHVEQASVDGKVIAGFPDSVFFQFQSSVFCLRKVISHHQYDAVFGTWEDLGNGTLRITFPDTAMRPDVALGLDSTNVVSVECLSSKKAVLATSVAGNPGSTIRYTLRHIP